MLFAAFLMTSCGPKTPDPIPLGNGNLTAYAQLDKATNAFLWGVRTTTSAQPKIKFVFKTIPTALDEFFIGDMADGQIVFDNEGKILVSGSNCTIETSPADANLRYIAYNKKDGKYAYLIKQNKTIGPKENYMFGDKQIYYLNKGIPGILSFDNKDILPSPAKELIIVVESKKVKGKIVETNYYLAEQDKGWNLYGTDGKLIKKIAAWQLKKFQKDAVKSELDKISFTKVAAI